MVDILSLVLDSWPMSELLSGHQTQLITESTRQKCVPGTNYHPRLLPSALDEEERKTGHDPSCVPWLTAGLASLHTPTNSQWNQTNLDP